MAKTTDEMPDPKKIEKRAKEAAALCKEMNDYKKELSALADAVKELNEKAG